MTDAEYFAIANGLPKRVLNGTFVVDWRSAIPACDPNIREACEWVLGFNPLSQCWVDPGAQYVNPPSPYPSASGWGVSLCNAPVSSGGGGSSGGSSGGGSSGGGGTTCATIGKAPLAGQSCCSGLIKDVQGICNTPNQQTDFSSINMNYVWIGLAVLGIFLFTRN